MPAPLLERMRDGRKSPQVLKIRLVAIRSSRPGSIVVFFEGQDDPPVYEEWFARTPARPAYESVPGSGKEQLLALQAALEQDGQLGGVYFIVDHDYDENFPLANVFVLDAYSIENVLCNTQSVESLIADELRCSGDPVTRESIIDRFERLLADFTEETRDLHEAMFVARREGLRIESKPEHVRDFISITTETAIRTYSSVQDVIRISSEPSPATLERLRDEFANLSLVHSVKGKYLMQALRVWMRLLADDRRSPCPRCFPESLPRLPGMPEQFSLRRLASLTPLPVGLADFAADMRRT